MDSSHPAPPPTEPAAATAAELVAMRRTGRVIPDLPEHLQPPDLAGAYAVQDLVVAAVLPEGARPVGYKCACTSVIAQEALAIEHPLFGRLLSHTVDATGATLDSDRFTHRVIEPEIAFRVGADVPARSGGHDRQSIIDYIDVAIPSIEIVDYRYAHWSVGALPVAADNAIHGWWIHGDEVADWHHLDLASMAVSASRNGSEVTTGTGANVLGHPLTVMAWLADELQRHGRHLQAGDLVTTGVTTDVFEAEPGDHIEADFAGLGSVQVSFAPSS
jgi:2-keto-4-pentenoate hydratase